MSKKYQVYKDIDGKFRFRLRAENNKIVAVGEAYEQHASCINGIKSTQTNCNAEVEDLTVTQKPKEETIAYDEIPEPKVEIPQAAVVPPVEIQTPTSAGPVQTVL